MKMETSTRKTESPLNHQGSSSSIANGSKLLTISDISEYLSIKQKTIYAKVEAGEIPHYRIGSLVRFRIEDINSWLEGCRRGEGQKVPALKKRRKTSVGKSHGSFEKIITKTIDEETNKYYSASYGKSDRIKGPKQEVEHGSI